MTPWVYDIECYKHLFCITFIPLNVDQRLIDAYIAADLAGNTVDKARLLKAMGTKQFTIFNGIKSINQSMLILDFFKSHKVIYGYNSYNYDATILDIFLSNVRYFNETTGLNKNKQHICEFMFRHSDACVGYGKGYWRVCDFLRYFKRPFTDYDIQKILYLDKSFTGLKQVAICLRWYRIQQLPFAVHHYIQDNEVEPVLDYNVNDVLITLTLVRSQKDELDLRVELNEEFGNKLDDNYHVDFRNMSRSSIGKTITTKYYSMISKQEPSEFTDKRTIRYSIHLQEIISDKITFQTKPFQDLLKSIKDSKIAITSDTEKAKWERTLLYNGTKYIVAKGGLHSKDNAIIYDDIDGCIYKDADVN